MNNPFGMRIAKINKPYCLKKITDQGEKNKEDKQEGNEGQGTSIIHLSDLESIYIGIRFKELESNENASKQIELPFMEVNLETMTAKVFS